ncbi:MAG: hypothetical protein CML20_02415 [Rheinheimera sp.]|uniref:DUF2237 family protein n=1 Tax=Arsukibacterium sp. UBA3155 TaxID=1946058 RepID=UPI000C8A7033|nr:DUF2237 domain-containing protein [Arsukibacterium sp. UBA3155]MAD73653.1 hypothetical protein [Rheinheimera sp.]|tara:strand:- start:219199 stop:219567 length:369 start_codon:yes stop_codon:yes gene_type:complete
MTVSPLNVLGQPLQPCCFSPVTGFFRDGYCRTNIQDSGSHVICARLTDAFLQYTLAQGNDLITAKPEWDFPGLKAGDHWCLCAMRWQEAEAAGVAPPVKLSACHAKALEYVALSLLQQYATE